MPGYTVSGTLGHEVMYNSPDTIVSQNGDKLAVNLAVKYISFSAHSDLRQTSEFLRELNPNHVILVHGAEEEMRRLRKELHKKFGEDKLEILCPRNCQAAEMSFTAGEKIARAVGALASAGHGPGVVSGLLLRQNFTYKLVADDELPAHTDLSVVAITQRPTLPYHGSVERLLTELSRLFEYQMGEAHTDSADVVTLVVAGAVKLRVDGVQAKVDMEWKSGVVNDMVGDALATMLLRLEAEAMSTGGAFGAASGRQLMAPQQQGAGGEDRDGRPGPTNAVKRPKLDGL